MSDNWLILIPSNPEFVPLPDARQRAVALFERVAPQAGEIVMEISEQPRFIRCGANFTKINCPHCSQKLGLKWWADWMLCEEKMGYPLRPAPLPCCGSSHNLSQLLYDWPQGFARFSLEAKNPNIRDLPDAIDYEFEMILGCGLRKIWRHI